MAFVETKPETKHRGHPDACARGMEPPASEKKSPITHKPSNNNLACWTQALSQAFVGNIACTVRGDVRRDTELRSDNRLFLQK